MNARLKVEGHTHLVREILLVVLLIQILVNMKFI